MLVADETCAPELEPTAFALIAFNDAVFVPGWFKQQVRRQRIRTWSPNAGPQAARALQCPLQPRPLQALLLENGGEDVACG